MARAGRTLRGGDVDVEVNEGGDVYVAVEVNEGGDVYVDVKVNVSTAMVRHRVGL